MPRTAALPRTISTRIPAPPTISARTTSAKSSRRTPSESSTTPREGSVSRPVNGGARNAASEPAITSSPKAALLARWSNRKRSRGREALDPADRLDQPSDEAPPAAAGPELDLAPALWQPDLVASGDQLKRHED